MSAQFGPFLEKIIQLALWMTIIVAAFVPLERLFAVHPHRVLRKGFWTDLGYYFLNGLTISTLLSVPASLLGWGVHQLIPASFLEMMGNLPLWARMSLGLVAGEIGYYWAHRFSHEIPFLWRFHAIHHSAEEVDFLTNSRAHPVDMVFSRFCGILPLYVLGLGGPLNLEGSVVPIAVTLFGTLWGFFIHANVKWRFGPLEWLISTPAFHHWHHTKSGPINRNYSSTLPWLDKLFGTLYLPNQFPDDYGIKGPMPDHLIDQLVHPLFPPPARKAPAVPALEEPPGPQETAEEEAAHAEAIAG
ncbi:MAG: sterol desaturase family protein [Isosphaeraceae bacterium]